MQFHMLKQPQRSPALLDHRHVLPSIAPPVRPADASARRSAPSPLKAAGLGWFDDPIDAREPKNPSPELYNEDFKPTPMHKRTFGTVDFAALWITLVISITTYYLAASLVDLGMSWVEGVITVFVGNVITLAPMVLNAHPGTKYGIPFPVLARSSFGIKGANLPSLSRALVGCGWFGIQTWVGGSSIYQMALTISSGAIASPIIPWLGISAPELACFGVFWAAQLVVLFKGMEAIRLIEKYSAPVLVALSVALLAWAVSSAGGVGPMLSAPSQFGPGMPKAGQFWAVFWPAVTANVGYWATLSLNIPDFTRYAKSQRDQLVGQALGLPPAMAAFTLLGLAVTSATIVIYGAPVVDPVQLLGKMESTSAICISLFGLMLATLTTNIAANIVATANALVNVAPNHISFVKGGLITAVLGALMMPWKLIGSSSGFIFTWLVGYSALMGPVIGIMMADYFIIRRRQLSIDELYSSSPAGAYWYKGGWNLAALVALALGVLPTLPGFLYTVKVISSCHPAFLAMYDVAWFVGAAVSTVAYCLLMSAGARQQELGSAGAAA